MSDQYNEAILDFDLGLLGLVPQAIETNVKENESNNDSEGKYLKLLNSVFETKRKVISADSVFDKYYALKEKFVELEQSLYCIKEKYITTSKELRIKEEKLKGTENVITSLQTACKKQETQRQVDKEIIERLKTEVKLLQNKLEEADKRYPVKNFNGGLPKLDECFEHNANSILQGGKNINDNIKIINSTANKNEIMITYQLPFTKIKESGNDSYIDNIPNDDADSECSNDRASQDTGRGSSLASPSDGETYFSMNNSPHDTSVYNQMSEKSNRVKVDVATNSVPRVDIATSTEPPNHVDVATSTVPHYRADVATNTEPLVDVGTSTVLPNHVDVATSTVPDNHVDVATSTEPHNHVDAATSTGPLHGNYVATSPTQRLKPEDVTCSTMQKTNTNGTITSKEDSEIANRKIDLNIDYCLPNNPPIKNSKNVNNEICSSPSITNKNNYDQTKLQTGQPNFGQDKECLQFNINENCDDVNSSDAEIEMILNKMKFHERMITPIPSTPVKQERSKRYLVCDHEFECLDAARSLVIMLQILNSKNCTMKEPVISCISDSDNNNLLTMPQIDYSKELTFENIEIQNKIQTHINESKDYQISNADKTKQSNLFDIKPIGNSGTRLSNYKENNFTQKNFQSNENIENKSGEVAQTLHYKSFSSPSTDDSLLSKPGDDIQHSEPNKKNVDLDNSSYAQPMLKQRKLTKLDKFRKKLLPKSKIRAKSPPIKKVRKKAKELLISKTLRDKQVTATLKNKNAVDNAIKVINELRHNQNSVELKQCFVSLNALDLQQVNSRDNEIESKRYSTNNMTENKIQNTNNSDKKIHVIEDILLTEGEKKDEIRKEDYVKNCILPKCEHDKNSSQNNVIISESPSAITIHRNGNVNLKPELRTIESDNSVSILHGHEKNVLPKYLADVNTDINDHCNDIMKHSKLNCLIPYQNAITTHSKSTCPVETIVMNNKFNIETSETIKPIISQRNNEDDVHLNSRHDSVNISSQFSDEKETHTDSISKEMRNNREDSIPEGSNREDVKKIEDTKKSTDFNFKGDNEIGIPKFESRKKSADSILQRSNEENIQTIEKKKSLRNNDGDLKRNNKIKNSADSILQRSNGEDVIRFGIESNTAVSVSPGSSEEKDALEMDLSQTLFDEDKIKNRKRKYSADDSVIECKRMLRSSTLNTSISEEQCVKTNIEPLTTQHNAVVPNSFDSKSTENITEKIQSSNINPKESLLCLMLDKYGKRSCKNKNKKLPDDIVSTITKTILDEVTAIVSAPAKDKKQHMHKFINIIRKWNTKHFMAGLMEYLKNSQRKLELYNKVALAPAPPMTKSEQALLCIIIQLSAMSTDVDIVDHILTNIEYVLFKLNRTPDFDSIESMSHFYAIICRYFQLKSRLRTFMLDAMYCIQFKAVPLVKQCLEVWTHILPLAHLAIAKSSLVTCMVYLLHFYKCEDRFNRVQEIRNILFRKYNYDIKDWNEPKLLNMLKNAIMSVRAIPVERKLLRISLIVIAKRHGPKWCQNNIIKNLLLPIIEDEKNPERVRNFCIMMLGPLMKPFPVDMKVHSEIVTNMLIDMLNRHPSPEMEEAIYTSLIFMSRHSFMRVLQVMLRWRPKQVSPDFESLIKDFVSEKPLKVWKTILSKVVLN